VLECCWCIRDAEAKISGLSLSKKVLSSSFKEEFVARKRTGSFESKRLLRMIQTIPLAMGRLGSTKGKIIKFL